MDEELLKEFEARDEIANRLRWLLVDRCGADVVEQRGDRITFNDNGRRVTLVVVEVR